MTDLKQASLETFDRREKVNIDSFTKFQKTVLMLITGCMMLFCVTVIAFGSNSTDSIDIIGKQDMINQVRDEKLIYIDSRRTAEQRQILEGQITVEALAKVKEEVAAAADPSSVDIEARVAELTGF